MEPLARGSNLTNNHASLDIRRSEYLGNNTLSCRFPQYGLEHVVVYRTKLYL